MHVSRGPPGAFLALKNLILLAMAGFSVSRPEIDVSAGYLFFYSASGPRGSRTTTVVVSRPTLISIFPLRMRMMRCVM